jgi:hypothetical protein
MIQINTKNNKIVEVINYETGELLDYTINENKDYLQVE